MIHIFYLLLIALVIGLYKKRYIYRLRYQMLQFIARSPRPIEFSEMHDILGARRVFMFGQLDWLATHGYIIHRELPGGIDRGYRPTHVYNCTVSGMREAKEEKTKRVLLYS